MNNTNEILERILLNMKYDSKKTLSENNESLIKKKIIYDIVTETTTDPPRKKVPKIEVGPLEVLPNLLDITFPKNPSEYGLSKDKLVVTKDYNNKTMKFYGQVHYTIKEYFDPYLEKINGNKYIYRKSSLSVWVPKTGNYYDLTGANNPKYSSHPGYYKTDKSQARIRNDWKKEDYAWEYTNDFIGNMALKCKQYYQNQYSKIYGRGGKKENLSYKYTDWYHEPKGVPGCVKKSIEKILNTGNSNAPYEFTAFNENLYGQLGDKFMGVEPHNGWERYTLQFNCAKYNSTYGSKIEGPCERGVKFNGYKSKIGLWFDTDSNSEKLDNYDSSNVCKWLNNPNSKYYYKKGWDYQRLVDEKIIADYPETKKMIENCIPKDVEYVEKTKEQEPEEPEKQEKIKIDGNNTKTIDNSNITLQFTGGK